MPYDQHETPYLDAVLRYRATGYTPFHTPGHKLGKGAPAGLRELLGDACLQVDVAMAGGVEDTRESTHLIRLAEDYAAEAWGSDRCWFLVNGSTSGIHALVLTLCGPGDEVIIPRNAHKSMLAGLIFSGAMPVYLEPEVDPLWGIPLTVSTEAAHLALADHPAAKAIFVTSPTYNGLGSDLAAVAAAAHAAGVPFVIDQAWGPHLRFCPELPVDAMTAGADAAVVSTHKLISGITQTSVLMARGERINLARLDSMVAMTQSTSPQVLMYASIDAARRQMATRGAELWRGALEQAAWARDELNKLPGVRCLGEEDLSRHGVASFDPTRLTISSFDLGHSGYELETVLRDDYHIAVEAADPLNVVLNVTYGDAHADIEQLVAAFRDYADRCAGQAGGGSAVCPGLLAHSPAFTRQVLSPREAFFAPSMSLPLAECAARVSAEMVTPYPPGIPVLGPGEAISDEIIAYLQEGAKAGLKVHGPEDRTLRSLRVVA
ncbi:MAG: aminotransferase class V-fold PLP-dependent enzyme [Actinobacteria bacterium]|nr:aminotransferase class V-fold PLP-dependent enzyme [Actinomycetota bacterium]